MTSFDASGKEALLKTMWEKEKLLVQAISPLLTMFSTLSKAEIIIFVLFNLSPANAFNLVWSKIFAVWEMLKNILTKGENVGNQHFLLLPQCFLPFSNQISLSFA